MGKRKSSDKIDKTALIIAIITLIGTLGSAYFVSRGNIKPTEMIINATETAQAVVTLISLSQTPVIIPILPTTIIDTPFPITPNLELSPISTNTIQPISTSTSDNHLRIENDCIDSKFWTPYDGKDIKTDSNDCLQLSEWGFFTQDGILYLLPIKNSENQYHGFFTSLSGDVDINFKFQVEKIKTGTRQANIRFGIVANDYSDGKYVSYQYLPDYPNNLYPKLWENGDYGDPFSVNLKMGKTQQVNISIRGNFLTVILDGQVVLDKLLLRFDNRLFSIDYSLPPSSDLSAYISEFSIERK